MMLYQFELLYSPINRIKNIYYSMGMKDIYLTANEVKQPVKQQHKKSQVIERLAGSAS